MKKLLSIISLSIAMQATTACVPAALIGGAGVLGYSAAEDRSVGTAIDDVAIEAKINGKLIAQDNRKDFIHVSEDSNDGIVLLTGTVPTREAKVQAYKIAADVSGVKKVVNEIKVDRDPRFSAQRIASDAWISTQLESKLLFTRDIKSINYSIETIDGVVYLMGSAQSKQELDMVTSIASEITGVQKVVSYVKIKGISANTGEVKNENRNNIPEEPTQTAPNSSRYQAPVGSSKPGALVIEESPNAQ